MFLDGQVGEKGLDLGSLDPSTISGHCFGRVTHALQTDAEFDPADVDLLGAIGVVFEQDGIPSASSPRLRSGHAG
jgi:hypothetical protein